MNLRLLDSGEVIARHVPTQNSRGEKTSAKLFKYDSRGELIANPLGETLHTMGSISVDAQQRILTVFTNYDYGRPYPERQPYPRVCRALSSDGSADLSFGNGGGCVDAEDVRYGDTLAAHQVPSGGVLVGWTGSARLIQWTDSGVRDPHFGTDGVVSLGEIVALTSFAIQSDGRILAATSAYNGRDRKVVRLTPSGELDPSFGSGGSLTEEGWIRKRTDDSFFAVSGGLLRRYLPDGSLDVTFGSGGVVDLHEATGGAEADEFGVHQIAEDRAGRLYVGAGWRRSSSESGETQGVLMTRLTSDGAIDPAFGVRTDFGQPIGSIASILEGADGKIWVSFSTSSEPGLMLLWP
ncbi:delta-60 repeat domain-containing protein [Myxococcus fulvus]|uniref:Delta-60 repeat domain-containing protein n=1 Tax=Myxococcus fulvus TaxID=33 RepID=A0A511TEW4_MYXFU|nr:hypothetical protein [Myxococcus fulvus]GEN12183.1 hypothetical protein MFU01_72200 [Myxococcus fulvus]SEU26900.1 delta-60 repeat domain-containing protein [Myxococcus fulvus]